MHLKSITSAKDAPFPNIEFVKVDKDVTEVIIGGKLRIRKGESYNASLQVLVATPHEEAKRFRMTATIDGFDPKISYHEYPHEADNAAADLARKGAETKVDEITVLIDENGAILPTLDAKPVDANGDDIPF